MEESKSSRADIRSSYKKKMKKIIKGGIISAREDTEGLQADILQLMKTPASSVYFVRGEIIKVIMFKFKFKVFLT